MARELAKLEEEWRASEPRLRQVLAAARVGVWEWDLHQDTLLWSAECYEIFGLEPSAEIAEVFWTLVHPGDRQRVKERLQRSLANSGTLADSGTYEDEYRIVRPGGEVRWVTCFGQLLRDIAGKPQSLLGTMWDSTPHRQTEEALHASEERYRTLVEDQTEVLSRFRPDGTLLFVSDSYCRFFGRTRDELLGMPWQPVVVEDGAEVEAKLHRLSPLQPLVVTECRVHSGSGQIRWMQFSNRGFFDDQGQLVEIQAVGRDITAYKQADEARRHLELQLRHAQKVESLGAVAGGIAHDFNNILAGIRGYADLILAEVPAGDSIARRAEEIRAATQRAADLTRQIMAYAGKAPFQPMPLDLSQVVESVQAMLEAVVSKKARLRYQLASGLPMILADASQIRQVIVNLTVNASEALRDNSGVISLTTRVVQVDPEAPVTSAFGERLAEGTYVCLEVADTGCGMDEPTRQRVFDPYFSTKFAGRGLGLATVRGILRTHHGAIQFSSGLGQGSRFRVFLPTGGPRLDPVKAEVRPVERHRSYGTVLVVDDEEMVRHATEVLFASAGFRVLTASDGQEAVRLFREHHAQIVAVILDLVMPKMSGEEVFHELRRIQSEVRVILTSGYLEGSIMERFAGQPIFAFVQKPQSFDDVIAHLQQTLAARA